MKSRILLPIALLGSVLTCFSQDREATHIISSLNTGEASKAATAKPLPDFKVQTSKTHRVDGRNITLQKVTPPEIVEVATSEQITPVQDEENLTSRTAPSVGLIFLTAIPAKGEGYDLEIGLNGQWLKAWTNIDARFLSGFSEFMANGRRYSIIGLPVAGKTELDEEPAAGKSTPQYFLTKFEGDEEVCRTLLKDLHDLYSMEKANLRRAYIERIKNQAKRAIELKANPPKKKDVIVRYWELSPEEIEKTRNQTTR